MSGKAAGNKSIPPMGVVRYIKALRRWSANLDNHWEFKAKVDPTFVIDARCCNGLHDYDRAGLIVEFDYSTVNSSNSLINELDLAMENYVSEKD